LPANRINQLAHNDRFNGFGFGFLFLILTSYKWLKESLYIFIMLILALIYFAESFIICCAIKMEEQTAVVKQEYNGYSLNNNKMIKSSLIAVGLIVIALLMLTQY
jgi:hypothetical protein